MHFNGQSATRLDGDHASGVTYCLAHHVKVDGSARSLMIAAIRYLDTFVKQDGAWFFSQRKLMVDWTETRPLGTGEARSIRKEFAMPTRTYGPKTTAAEISRSNVSLTREVLDQMGFRVWRDWQPPPSGPTASYGTRR